MIKQRKRTKEEGNQPEELLNQAWSKPKYRHRAKNVLTLIARSTDVTMWVATSILLQETLKGRVRALSKLISIAEVSPPSLIFYYYYYYYYYSHYYYYYLLFIIMKRLLTNNNIKKHLRKLNNFNSVMAVIAGINLSSVYRLKFTRGGITPQIQEVLLSPPPPPPSSSFPFPSFPLFPLLPSSL